MEIYKIALAFLTSFVIAAAIMPKLARIAVNIGLLDYPHERKMHASPKPLVGGIGMLMAFIISAILFVPLAHLRGFYAGIILLAFVGFLDDFKELDHRWKFLVQIFAAIVMIHFSNVVLSSFGNLFGSGEVRLHAFAIPLTIFGTIGVINSINMIDGLDGLAGGLSLVSLLSLGLIAYIGQRWELLLLIVALLGAIVGFLIYNRHPAKLFMGDAGSLTLGFALAFFSIDLTQHAPPSAPPVFPLLVLAVPLVDTVTVMLKRMFQRKSPFYADKEHLHHHLISMGFSKKAAVDIIIVLSMFFSLCALYGVISRWPDYSLFSFFMFFFGFYAGCSFFIKQIVCRVRPLIRRREEKTAGRTA